MRAFSFFAFCLIIGNSELVWGQCPDKDSIWKSIATIRKSSSPDKIGELKTLLTHNQQIENCRQGVDSVYTFLLLSIGVTYYRLADYNNAIRYTRRALNYIETNVENPAINKTYLTRYYYYLSIYYDSLNLVSQKNEAIDSCISNEIRANSDYHFASLVLEDNVKYLYNIGDYNLCADRATLGETLIRRFYQYADSLSHIFYFIYYKASALRSLKRFYEEEQFLESKKTVFLKLNSKDYTSDIYSLFGYLYETKGDYEKAIKYFQKAFYYDRFSSWKGNGASVLSKIGMIYHEKYNDNGRSVQYFHNALDYAKNRLPASAASSDSFYILGNIANVYARMNMFDSAFYFFQKAFDIVSPGMQEIGLLRDVEKYVNQNSAESVLKLVIDKGDSYLRQYKYRKDSRSLQKALNVYKTADRLLGKIESQISEVQSRLFWQSEVHRLYENAVEVSYLQNNFNDAFYFFEKSRAVLLTEQLRQQSRTADEELLKQAQLKKKQMLLEREQNEIKISSHRFVEIQKELIVVRRDLERLGQTMRLKNPLYYQNFVDTSFITLEEVKEKLFKDHQVFLEMFEGDSAVYSLVITPGQTYFNKINKSEFDITTKKYIAYISDHALLNRHFADYAKTANHLYMLIFGGRSLPGGRIIISPNGHYFPFESLVVSVSGEPAYFLERHAVSYTYSARYLMNDFSVNGSVADGNFLGVAPVRYRSSISLVDLQGSDLSVKEIGSHLGKSRIFIGGHATKNEFLQQYSKYRIIQLYTHAADTSSYGEPVIYFVDSTLYLSELIAENKPVTRLIILSACETGIGKLYDGEGVFSFNRGFAALGIPAAITNLWSVDNKATYKITELFYQYLRQGLPSDVALQKAKLEFLQTASREKSLPFYWAAPVLVGKAEIIELDRQYPWNWIAVFAGLGILVVWTMRKWMISKKWSINEKDKKLESE